LNNCGLKVKKDIAGRSDNIIEFVRDKKAFVKFYLKKIKNKNNKRN
jgi:hypothetical protein